MLEICLVSQSRLIELKSYFDVAVLYYLLLKRLFLLFQVLVLLLQSIGFKILVFGPFRKLPIEIFELLSPLL